MNRRHALSFIAASAFAVALSVSAFAAGFAGYTASAFDSALKSGAEIVVHVHADWCPTCRAQAPTLTELSNNPAYAKVKFIRVNFDKDTKFLKAHKVSAQATILVFKDGKEATRFTGVTDAQQIRNRIAKAL